MRIKKLELIGFKSFADRTEILLNEGVTCVVGPNGCGKSNIADAIRWVFGERSAKLLRGSRMEDVIFNGTEFRKPLGMAEVSLLLDNADRSLPLEYEEVVFTRRLYRSGQSEYFLNRTPCRLKDLLALILDTGMGSNAYSMIEQGRIDFILNADPPERRYLIEEAAGISKYKVKKEEALRKLERTEQNLLRIRDIVLEVQKNIQYAERQARRAERYKIQFEALKKLEIQKAFLDLSSLGDQKEKEKTEREKLREASKTLEEEIQGILKKQEEQQRLLDEVLAEESKRETYRFELRAEDQGVAQRRQLGRERLEEYRARQAELDRERETLGTSLRQFEGEAQGKLLELERVNEHHQSAQEEFRKEKERFDREELRFHKLREEAVALKTLFFESASELTRLRNEANRLQALLDNEKHQRGRDQGASQKLLNEKTDLEKKQVFHREELAACNRELEEMESAKAGSAQSLSEVKEDLEALRRVTEEKRFQLQERRSRWKLLSELEATSVAAERKLLTTLAQERLQGKFIQTLRDVFEIRTGYESAVEAVLGAFAQGLIAEDVETAKGLILEMAQAHMGPCGIFVRSLVKRNGRPLKKAAVSHPLIRYDIAEVVQIQKGMETLFQPFFENVYVVEDFSPEHLPDLLPLAQDAKLVTKQGVLLGPEARIFFRNGKLSPDQGSFERRAEIESSKQICASLQREVEDLNCRVNEKANALLRLTEEVGSFMDKGREILVRREATESSLRGLEERLLRLEDEIRLIEFEVKDSDRESAQATERMAQIQEDICRQQENEGALSSRQKELEESLKQIQIEREQRLEILARLKAGLETHEERQRVTDANVEFMRSQIENGKERMNRMTEEREELVGRVEKLQEEEAHLLKKQETLETNQREAEEHLSEVRSRKRLQGDQLREFSNQLADLETQLKTLREALHQQELKEVDLSYRERNISERLEQAYRIRWGELQAEDFLKETIDPLVLEEEIRALKEKVESFGPVNLLAVEEYEELKQRYDFLANQEKDLKDARESLLEAIRKINRTTKALFSDTFMKVQATFLEHFQILFGGGHAELLLLDGENPQESGIDIVVRPPGKKLQHINLLSGGEKALTALALLFALFRIKPSPFCVLDEVDAPLDEANVDRFLKVLRTFLDSTQFLIVTHNRKTIGLADSLYGVTMEESGISKIVSVKVTPKESFSEVKVPA